MSYQPKLIELRPNRAFLHSDFDGYKLSLAELTTVTEQLKFPVDRLVPNISQYSHLHAKLFGLHNHLVGETGELDCVYFFDKNLNLQKYTLEAITNKFSSSVIWNLPLQKERHSGDYNISMKLVTDKIAVVADGAGFLHVLDRGFKATEEKWSVIFSSNVTGVDESFTITDVVYKETHKPELHLLLSSIKTKGENERYSTVLNWITLENSDSWNQVALRELTVNGFVQYANFERTCNAIYVISDSGCKFTLDSENGLNEIEPQDIKKYEWTQGKEEINIKLYVNRNINKNLLKIVTEPTKISVKYEDKIFLEGILYQRIDSNLTTWNLENVADIFVNATLQIVLQKTEVGLIWPEFIKGDKFEEYISDGIIDEDVIVEQLAPFTSDEEAAPSSGTTFNSQQVEECDFECDKLTIFERICQDSHKVTHKANLGSHQVFLTVNLDKYLPLALATRTDVDACIWQPTKNADDFCIEHKGTLLAMGYIQASKQQMKFFVCSPDLSYCAISESTRHLFIYCQNKTISFCDLKNRTTGKRFSTVSQQQVYSLPHNDEILGLFASNSYLYILCENFITALKL